MSPTNMQFTIELLETNQEIERKILEGIAEDFNLLITPKLQTIRDRVAVATIEFLKMSDTYESLTNGLLAGHFGLPVWGRHMMVNNILKQIGKSIEIDYTPIRVSMGGFIGGANINVLISDFSDLLTMMEAEVVTEKGQWLPYLEFLLLRGDRIIISQYDVKMGSGIGRSGMAIMIKGSAKAWRVPTAYSGVMGDNWLTRFFEIYQKAYSSLIEEILQEELGL
jgi:hypothetical protein